MVKKEKKFEEALKELEQVVKQLENGDVSLEEAIQKFQEGIQLSQYCNDLLKKAEETVISMITKSDQEIEG